MPGTPDVAPGRRAGGQAQDRARACAGICLRGKPGWGEILAPLDTVINTFGGRWFDHQWNAQLTSPQVEQAASSSTSTWSSKSGELGAAQTGFHECANHFGQGKAAMWYDATSAAASLEDPEECPVVGKIGYLPAPIVEKPNSGWLYTWSLGIPKTRQEPGRAPGSSSPG